MSGTAIGGKKAALKNKAIYGEDFYRKIGSIGGKRGTTGGFYANRELARIAGQRGGRISKRSKKVIVTEEPIHETTLQKIRHLLVKEA